jgi:hypothetical protein
MIVLWCVYAYTTFPCILIFKRLSTMQGIAINTSAWLKHYATSREAAGSMPDEVIFF